MTTDPIEVISNALKDAHDNITEENSLATTVVAADFIVNEIREAIAALETVQKRTAPILPPEYRYEFVRISFPKNQSAIGKFLDPHERDFISIGGSSIEEILAAVKQIGDV